MRTRAAEQFDTVRTEGGLLPPGLLARVAAGDQTLPALTPEAYHLTPSERFGEVINRSWSRLVGAWASFSDALSNLSEGDAATGLTRERWLLVLFAELGYGRLPLSATFEIDGETYPVSHTWGAVPIHLVGAGVDLDRRTPGVAGAARLSPHSLVQDLLNRDDERLWGFVSNGLDLRILRDNLSLTRQAYVEFDLKAMMDGEVYSDFVVLWLLAHQSRFEAADVDNYWIELWSIEARVQGTRALDHLRDGVETSITALGNGFLRHGQNIALRKGLQDGDIRIVDYYRQLLRIVYRLLFLLVAEERDLLLVPHATPEAARRYSDYYSIRRLRDLAERRRGSAHEDLWVQVQTVVALLGQPAGCPDLGLPGLGGFLFSEQATPDLDRCRIANTDVLTCLRALSGRDDRGYRQRHDYRNLGVEELGSVYESLLELHPEINVPAQTFVLSHGGEERRATGSHYTPPKVLKQVLDFALEPAIERALTAPDREAALLDLRVLDPAAGSGHFLIAAAHRIARALASVRTDELEPTPAAVRTSLREVVAKCIYGVDLNPMAVELCRVALWLETLEPGKPLSFIDHHVRVGNSLIGVPLGTTVARNRAAADAEHATLAAKVAELTEELGTASATGGRAAEISSELRRTRRELELAVYDSWVDAIPDAAFKATENDNAALARRAVTSNRRGRQSGQLLLSNVEVEVPKELAAEFVQMREAPQDTFAEITVLAELFDGAQRRQDYLDLVALADTWTSAFFWPLLAGAPEPPTQEWFATLKSNPRALPSPIETKVDDLASEHRFFHFETAFLDVFRADRVGFDVVVGNPPYLGGPDISGTFGENVLKFLKDNHRASTGGRVDLAVYFIRRGFDLLREGGELGFITTKSVAEGDSLLAGLRPITTSWGGTVVDAIRSMPWEGSASIDVAVIHLHRGSWDGHRSLDGHDVDQVAPTLTEGTFEAAIPLLVNSRQLLKGANPVSTGFRLREGEYERLIGEDQANGEVIKAFFGADDLAGRIDAPPRWIIDFGDRTLEEAEAFSAPLALVESRVRPEREELDEHGEFKVKRKAYRERWWRFAERSARLHEAVSGFDNVIAIPEASKLMLPARLPGGAVYLQTLFVFTDNSDQLLGEITSSIHWLWAARPGGAASISIRPRYHQERCFETFPRPPASAEVATAACELSFFRDELMVNERMGTTDLYNRVNDLAESSEAVNRMRELHNHLDYSVARAYGWHDLDLDHGVHPHPRFAARWLPHPLVQTEILRRLLALNRELAQEQSS